MLKDSEIKKVSKDDHPRKENAFSQPLNHQPIFNQPHVITESWYPVCPASSLKENETRSFTMLQHRFVVWRGKSGKLYAMDSFCPHMGADLGNGNVIGENLQCYFHHWIFLPGGKCANHKEGNLESYPVEEKYGFIWIYPGKNPTHSVPQPPGLLNQEVDALYLKKLKLYAHHHVMMAGGIDLQHFKSVHKVDIKFDYQIIEHGKHVYTWDLSGILPSGSLLLNFTRWLTGGEFKYQALFAGGSIVSLTYGNDLRFRGRGFKLPNVSILWAGRPTVDGVSEVDIFIIRPKFKGLLAPIKKFASTLFSIVLLAALRDDDTKAFPHMRFNVGLTTEGDKSVMDLVSRINEVPVSHWTKDSREK
ncbi:Rieske 2Fe-2S domain-containing protein [Peredibacter starrii]|uniref:Rieske 2Fe-2S domain-containing protein n=1 Tax=Peredibacter starrii TaxID=28202 RepID=A0AAX4HQ76_9BACT|nr:Rieske 2Fe-2S domain-containing protein [Peredibacter starrii]WPU65434.1 Rieske 2Fe-2S domain-containing protein [Peredibacter starrii]